MGPPIKPSGRIKLHGSMDQDVYQILKKLEDTVNDGRPFKSVFQAYDAVKRSNSSLSRQKKRPLEDSIDRVLRFRTQERDESDSEAAIDDAMDSQSKKEDDRFLLNKQMVKNWKTAKVHNTTAATNGLTDELRATKKRRLLEEGEDLENGLNDTRTPKTASRAASVEAYTVEKSGSQRKSSKPSRFKVEHVTERCPLGGVADIFREMLEQVGPTMKSTRLFEENHYRKVPGIVVSGPPGSGKKSLTRNLASALELPMVFVSPCLEDPDRLEKSLIEAFDEAARVAPAIVFIEHLDQHMSKPDATAHNEHHRRVVSQFSRHMERLARQQPNDQHILAIATTSRIAEVDPTVLKTGLFEHTLQVKVPDVSMRQEILSVVLENTPLSADVKLPDLAKATHGYVGADIVNIVTSAQRSAAIRAVWNTSRLDPSSSNVEVWEPEIDGEHALTMSDFAEAIKAFTPSLRKEGFTVVPDVTWDSVGALESVRDQLHMSIIGPIRNPDLYQGFGLTRPAGVLLWGPPGCGKTLVAQAVANAAQASFILINGPELLNKYVGESERAVRELFQRARSSTPCILFFDEIDSLVPRRDNASTEAGARVVNALLTELDGARDRRGIYVIGTTNRPDMIDAAMLRPGRLSERLFVDLPTAEERVDILKAIYRTAHHANRPIDDATEASRIERVARDVRCENFSGADLGGLHIKAAERALRRYLSLHGKAALGAADTLASGGGDTGSGGAAAAASKVIGDEDWEYALANTQRSVMNPDTYRKLNARLRGQ